MFSHTTTTDIYPRSLRGALPIPRVFCTVSVGAIAVPPRNSSTPSAHGLEIHASGARPIVTPSSSSRYCRGRSEEHTSELQSRQYLVCRILLEQKKEHTSNSLTRP